ncbi:MAG: DUF47 family protein [Magnetococcales bacterium]|nr:DUF47 family protein [Magnetococcales bacterium]NGZ27951.1 DUF47 family protein [Magnetococcales bacterium]
MAGASNTLFSRMSNRVFPRMPDFYGLIMDQCNLAVQVAGLLEEYVQGNKSRAEQILKLEEEAEKLRDRNLEVLKTAFATPMDREDIYRAYISVDCIIPYANTIVRDMESLDIKADKFTTDMVAKLRNSVETLRDGYQKLATSPNDAEKDAQAVAKTRAAIEKDFRTGTSKLFKADDIIKGLQDKTADADAKAMGYVLDIFKRREVYRLLHDAGNSMGDAGKVLHDIVVQIA